MVEAEAKYTYERPETPKQPGERPEFGHSERRVYQTPEEKLKVDKRIGQLVLELHNHPTVAVIIPKLKQAGKSDIPNSGKLSIWDLLMMLLEMMVEGGKRLLPNRAGKNS